MKPIRTIAEKLARGRTLVRKISVSGKKVPIIVSPDAQLKYLKLGEGAFDQDLISIAERFLNASSRVWDIGANVGVFTFASASIASEGTVVAVEADIWLASVLRKSARLKAYEGVDIRIVPLAVSNADSVATFLIAQRGRASNALESAGGRSQMGGTREKQYVPTLKLDSLLQTMPAPEFVKIDVEGAESMVIEGAEKILREIRPIFYIEIGESTADSVFGIFHQNNYQAYAPDGRALQARAGPNTFFIPKENQQAAADAGFEVA